MGVAVWSSLARNRDRPGISKRCFTSTPKILSGFQRRDWAIVQEQEARVAGDFDACWGDVMRNQASLGSEASYVEMLNAGPPSPSSSEDGKSFYEQSLRAMGLETAQLDETCDWGRCSVEF